MAASIEKKLTETEMAFNLFLSSHFYEVLLLISLQREVGVSECRSRVTGENGVFGGVEAWHSVVLSKDET